MTQFTSLEFNSPNLQFYNNRLKTFDTWSLQIRPDKYQLSSAGFFYTGRSDIVECFSCALRLQAWTKEDDPLKEHKSHSVSCLFLDMISQSKSDKHQSLDLPWSSAWTPWSSACTLPWSNSNLTSEFKDNVHT